MSVKKCFRVISGVGLAAALVLGGSAAANAAPSSQNGSTLTGSTLTGSTLTGSTLT